MAVWAVTTLVFFSISVNKLPGYVLPVLPPLCALIGIRLGREPSPRVALPLCALLLALLPLAGAILPAALADGIRDAWPPEAGTGAALALAAATAAASGALLRRGRPRLALGLVATGAVLGLTHLKTQVFPALDEVAGARAVWKEAAPRANEVCVGDVRRHVEYGLDFYADGALTPCGDRPRSLRIEGDPPRLVK